MSGHTPWREIRRGPPGSWNPVAGDDRELHYFADTTKLQWWMAATCGKGPAVGKSDSDARLGVCPACLPTEPEDLEEVEGIHA